MNSNNIFPLYIPSIYVTCCVEAWNTGHDWSSRLWCNSYSVKPVHQMPKCWGQICTYCSNQEWEEPVGTALEFKKIFPVWCDFKSSPFLMLMSALDTVLTKLSSADSILAISLLALLLPNLYDNISLLLRPEVCKHHLLSFHSMYRYSERCMGMNCSRILERRYWVNYYLIKTQIKAEDKMTVWALRWSLPEPIRL